jgi:hypothetical protein
MQAGYFLEHKRENRFLSCRTRNGALTSYFMQWRDPDGSIPWTLHYCDPESGNVYQLDERGNVMGKDH